MSTRLEQAFQEAAQLPESNQESFAEFLLAELNDYQQWPSKFSGRPAVLTRLADEASADHAAGRTRPIEDLFN